MSLFRNLSVDEELHFRQWARENYVALMPINGVWHPCVQAECVEINREHIMTRKAALAAIIKG